MVYKSLFSGSFSILLKMKTWNILIFILLGIAYIKADEVISVAVSQNNVYTNTVDERPHVVNNNGNGEIKTSKPLWIKIENADRRERYIVVMTRKNAVDRSDNRLIWTGKFTPGHKLSRGQNVRPSQGVWSSTPSNTEDIDMYTFHIMDKSDFNCRIPYLIEYSFYQYPTGRDWQAYEIHNVYQNSVMNEFSGIFTGSSPFIKGGRANLGYVGKVAFVWYNSDRPCTDSDQIAANDAAIAKLDDEAAQEGE